MIRPVRDRGSTLLFRHRRGVTVPLIVAFHALILFWVASMPPPPLPNSTTYMDVGLFDGRGGPSPIDNAPTPEPGTDLETVNPEREVREPLEEDVVEPTEADETPPTDSTEAQTTETATEAAAAAEPEIDVLAMVEQITGVKAEAAATAPATQMATVSMQQALKLRERSLRSGGGGGCAIEASLDEGLKGDAVVRASLAQVQYDQRSVSNAIQLWDGAWIPVPAADGTDTLATVQQAVVAAIDAAPARCRNQLVQGPRFFLVEGENDLVTVLVMGSGEWRWRDLLPERKPALFRWFGRANR